MATELAKPQSNEFAAGAEAALRTAIGLLTELRTKVEKANGVTPPPPAGETARPAPPGPRGVAPRVVRP